MLQNVRFQAHMQITNYCQSYYGLVVVTLYITTLWFEVRRPQEDGSQTGCPCTLVPVII